ncbi:hypothetical protein ACQ4PT_028092 [Festuca glaucescens]
MPDAWRWGMESYSHANLPPPLFTRQTAEDGRLGSRKWAADQPESDDEGDQGADEDEELEGDAGTSGVGDNRGKSASSHPLRDWNDEYEVMVLEPLDVPPIRSAPPAAGQAPVGRKRKDVRAQPGASASWPAKKPARTRRPKDVPKAAGAPLRLSKAGASSSPADTVSPPPPPRRREPTALTASSGTSDELAHAEEEPAASWETRVTRPTVEEVLERSRPKVAAPGGAEGGDGAQDRARMGGAGLDQPLGSEPVAPPPSEPNTAPTPEPATRKVPELAEAKAKGEAAQPDKQVSLHASPAAQLVATRATSSTSILGSLERLQQEWADTDLTEVTNKDGTVVGPAMTQGFFNNLRIFISGAAKETLNQIHQTEKSVAECNNKRVAMFGRAVGSYKKVNASREALVKELQVTLGSARWRRRWSGCGSRGELTASHQARLEALRAAHQEKVNELRQQLKQANAERTKEAALDAASAVRVEQHRQGLDVTPYFSIEEHLAAMNARLRPMQTLGQELRRMASEIFTVH